MLDLPLYLRRSIFFAVFHHFQWTPISRSRNALTAEYEPVQPFYLLSFAETVGCQTFIDVGANIGAYSLFATLVPTVDRVLAFEANPEAAGELQRNVELNHASVEVRRVAVSDREGEVSFGVVGDYAGNNAVIATSIHDTGIFKRHISVQAIALDSISGLQGPICLKIDVEGHELPVLKGATLLLRQPCAIQVEDYGGTIGKFLESLGYSRLTSIGPDRYYSNVPGLDALQIYERSMRRLIESNHEAARKRVPEIKLGYGDFAFRIGGGSANGLRKAKKLLYRPFRAQSSA